MRTNMLVFGSLYLLLSWMRPAYTQWIFDNSITQDDQSFSLDMAKDSVDDMYFDCATKMESQIKSKYFQDEMKNEFFKAAWAQAKDCANQKYKNREKGDEALTKDHMQAICTYTAGGKENFYQKFNEEVRTKRKAYGSSFQFHSLHFWLTRAVQILNNQNKCYTTFRRTKSMFNGNVKQEVRFGTFTSTSKLSNLERFGDVTCFKIRTCHAAYLKKYPKLADIEQEVLIPPYEKFRIIKKGKPDKQLSDCAIVYVLNSTGFQSNLDCQLVKQIL
ncbi:erythroblast NAD(P)(+)--arginine ADP-ribosyltransferase-like [Cyprinodon tularosa]|uniref:erythroblast NAD(P)(+)--arginine ADP-ribosyltransferase-like n=1 Tax=Cyprinodon tularosa TaxID=77115 RepID=UPI0018E1DBB7|nr:erythroblast NAD(P)(+)--arginine ADP-ribosyltransferase-like [Cyprinodon tularosa]